ncbi:hypothetical protein HDE_01347 [Halotydeus destructor]|nr:hypothetical protein HDE_01347 [Halotydeus destructor]
MEDTKRKLATFVQRVKAETNTSYSVLKASVSSSALAGLADSVRHKTRSLLAANGREADHHYHHQHHSDKKQQPRKAREEPVASSGDFDWDHEFEEEEEDSGDSEEDYSAVDSGEGDESSPAWLRLDLQSREQAEQWLRRPGVSSGSSSSSGCPFVVRPAQRAGPQYPLCLSLLSRTDQVVYHLPVRCQQQQQHIDARVGGGRRTLVAGQK